MFRPLCTVKVVIVHAVYVCPGSSSSSPFAGILGGWENYDPALTPVDTPFTPGSPMWTGGSVNASALISSAEQGDMETLSYILKGDKSAVNLTDDVCLIGLSLYVLLDCELLQLL